MKKAAIDWTAMRTAMAGKKTLRYPARDTFGPLFIAAALRASFTPEKLTTAVGQTAVASEGFNQLLNASEVVYNDGRLEWQLQMHIRKKVLKSLGSLAAMKPHLPKGEKYNKNTLQRMLSAYVLGTAKPLREQTLDELGATYRIAGWLHEISPAAIPDPMEVEIQLNIAELTAPFRKLTRHFQGRQDELSMLRAHNQWPPLLIHGLGGSGKSTLIARFILDHLKGSDMEHIPFIYLDFDRPGISVREPLTLLFEGLRQLVLQFPGHEKVLGEYRSNWERDLLNTEQSQVRMFAQKGATRVGEQRYYLRDFDTIWHSILGLSDRPLLFVLDSFEEVQYRATLTDLIGLFDFLNEMSSLVPRLRVVISGRSELPKELEVRQLFVGPFDAGAAIGYLAQKGIKEEKLAARIFEHIGGNPLSLSLAASVILKEIRAGNNNHEWLLLKTEGENLQELLFRRNLEHIHLREVRQLAFPGLTVRQISPAVVQHILAGPCGLGTIGEQKARELFEELKRETFLVNIDEHGRFRFRPDLRQLLIDLVQKQDPERTRQIHDLAVEYYGSQPGPEARAELVYHALRRGDDPNTMGQLVSPELQPYLESSLSEFSPNNYLFLASVFGLEVPDEVRQRADLIFWEEKMISELEELLAHGTVGSFPIMKERLEEQEERSADSSLQLLEASFYELAGELKRAFQLAKIALHHAKKYLNYQRQVQALELLSRICARRGDFGAAEEYARQGIAIAKANELFLQAVGMMLYQMQFMRRQNKQVGKVLEELILFTKANDAALHRLFLENYRMQKYVPPYDDPVAVLSFLKNHLSRFLPSMAWEPDSFPGTVAGWLEMVVKETLLGRWLPAARFTACVEAVKSRTQGSLEVLEKFSKDNFDVFLREVIPPSVFDISVYDLVVFAETEGRADMLTGASPPTASAAGTDDVFRIFISYSADDEEMKNELDEHLAILRRSENIRLWSQSDLLPGEDMQKAIEQQLHSAHLILLLISEGYLNDKNLYEKEMKTALVRQKEEGIMVVPVYLKPAPWEETGLRRLQGLPREGRPCSSFKDRDKAYNEVAVGLRRMVDRILKA